MINNLNKAQKIFLSCIGVIIITFQLYKFSEDGIEGSGWIISFVAGALFILPIFSFLPEWPRKKHHTSKTSSGVRLHPTLASEAWRLAQVLHVQLKTWIVLPDDPELERINKLTRDHWLQQCLSYTFALICLSEFKKKSTFLESDAYKSLFVRTVNKLVSLIHETSTAIGLADKMTDEQAKKLAVTDLMDARAAVLGFINAILADSKGPDADLIEFMAQKIGVTADLKKDFSDKLRVFTKKTLTDLSQE